MEAFTYLRPKSLTEALSQLSKHAEALPLAGGMSLLSAMKLRLNAPTHLVDLQAIPEMRGIVEKDNCITIGAMTRHAEVAASALVRDRLPVVADLAFGIGDRQVRNRGTIGGSVANNDPSACYPSAVLGLGATVVTSSREIAADDFFVDLFTTAIEEGELLTAVRFPRPQMAAYVKFHQQASRFALIGVFVAKTAEGRVRVAVTGGGYGVFRAEALEEALERDLSPQSALDTVLGTDRFAGDIHGDPEYRAALTSVCAARAVERMLGNPPQ